VFNKCLSKETAEGDHKDNWLKLVEQYFDYFDFDPADTTADHTKRFTFDQLKEQCRDSVNFRAVNTIHEDAKGVWFRDYMWFLSDEDNTLEKASGAFEDWPNN